MNKLFYQLSWRRSFTRSLLILAFIPFGLFHQNALATHGTTSSGSTKLFGSELECVFDVGDTTIEYVPSANDANIGKVIQKSIPQKTVTCCLTLNDEGHKGCGEFSVDLTAELVRVSSCEPTGANSSQRSLTSICGDSVTAGTGKDKATTKADIKGTLTALDNNPLCNGQNPCVVNIGGADALKPKGASNDTCTGVFGLDTNLLLTTQSFPESLTCDSTTHIDDGQVFEQMCHSGFSFDPAVAAACIVTVNKQTVKRIGTSEQDQVKIVVIDVDPGTVNTSSCTNHILTVDVFGQTTFDVRQIDVATVRLGDGTAPDEPVAISPAGNFRVSFGDSNSDGIEDIRIQFNRCNSIIDQLIAGDTILVLTGETLGAAPFQGQDTVSTN